MEKGVARTVGQLDEPESPFGLEPFDDGADRRSGGRASNRGGVKRGELPNSRKCGS